jgi:hypothetical protein
MHSKLGFEIICSTWKQQYFLILQGKIISQTMTNLIKKKSAKAHKKNNLKKNTSKLHKFVSK